MERILPPASHKNPDDHLRNLLTHPWYGVINRLHAEILRSTAAFYDGEGIDPTMFPITTGSISSPMGAGSDSQPVRINIKGNDVYLADSMQFCLEIGARLNAKGAYYIMPTFRGEDTDARHLNEFTHSEAEINGTLEDALDVAERYVQFMAKHLLAHRRDDIIAVTGSVKHLEQIVDRPFKRIRFEDALKELQAAGKGYAVNDGVTEITPEGERLLIANHGEMTWLTHMPWNLVPFYQSQEAPDSEYSNTADLLAGIGEILGMGQRVLDGADLDRSLAAHHVDIHEYQWYRELHEDYTVQTSGYGLGIERLILWVLRHDDIRDCTLLLRDHDRVILP